MLIPAGRSTLRLLASTCFMAALLPGPMASAERPIPHSPMMDRWTPNGRIEAMAEANGILYLGGSFSMVGPNTPGAAAFNLATAAPLASFPAIEGAVHAVVSDGQGGWYLGGSFTHAGGQPRGNLVHLLSTGAVDTDWRADADDLVRSLAYVAATGTLYVAGDFAQLGNESRMRLGAVRSDGTVTDWQPGPNWLVYDLALSPDGGTLYVGGYFTTLAGETRTSAAAFNTTTGALTAWNPTIDHYVKAIGVSEDGTTVYVGGRFQLVNGQVRQRLAGLAASDASLTGLDAATGGNTPEVLAIVESNGRLYVGGTFLHIGGAWRSYIAALNPATGAALDWDPGADAQVDTLAVAEGMIYAGGGFREMGGLERWHFAVVDAGSGEVTGTDLSADEPVKSIEVRDGLVCAGGAFKTMGGARRPFLAAIEVATGRPTPWEPRPDSWVSALALSPDGQTLYVAGLFGTMLEQERWGLAAVSTQTGLLTDWTPFAATPWGFGTPVARMLVHGETVYLAGQFSEINNLPRANLAAVDALNGQLRDWNPNADGDVRALAIWNDQLIAGGSFSQIGGRARNNLAAMELSSASATDWNPAASGSVEALAVHADTLFVGGAFDQIAGQARANLGAVGLNSGEALNWNPGADGAVMDLVAAGGRVLLSGGFSQVAGQPRAHLAAVSLSTGTPDPWNPSADADAHRLLSDGEFLFVAGDFTRLAGDAQPWLSAFSVNTLPQAHDAALSAASGTASNGTLQAVDPDDDVLTFSVSCPPEHGLAEVQAPTGAYLYTPASGYTGSDSFTFQACDAWGCSDTATVSITIAAAPEPEPEPEVVTCTLTTLVEPAGGGSIARSPQAGSYAQGTTVTLTAQPADGFTFVKWSGDAQGIQPNITVTLSSSKQVTAVFLKATHAGESSISEQGEAQLSLASQPGLLEAALTLTGGTSGGTVRALISRAEDHPVRSFAGFAGEQALDRRLTIDSDLENGTFTALIELYYTDAELGTLDESRLRLFHWDEDLEQWQTAGTHDRGDSVPTSVPGDYGVDLAGNRVWAVVTHFSEFAAGMTPVPDAPPQEDPDIPQEPSPQEPADPLDEEEQVDSSAPEAPEAPVCGACGAGAPLALALCLTCCGWARARRQGR